MADELHPAPDETTVPPPLVPATPPPTPTNTSPLSDSTLPTNPTSSGGGQPGNGSNGNGSNGNGPNGDGPNGNGSRGNPWDRWRPLHAFTLFAILVAIGLVGWFFPARSGSVSFTQMGHNRLASWLIIATLLIAFICVAGHWVTGYWRGLLIDDRNKMSLARFQLVIWTVIVLSGFVTGALWNIARHATNDALAIAIPAELWQVMGISTASLVGSSLILSTKAQNETVSRGQVAKTTTTLTDQEKLDSPLTNRGVLVVKGSPKDAHWVDMFKGEETGNAAYLDLGKVQMFFFTLILAFAYATKLATLFNSMSATNLAFTSFPALDPSMVTLLGISHVGYLGYKAAPHSDPSPSPQDQLPQE